METPRTPDHDQPTHVPPDAPRPDDQAFLDDFFDEAVETLRRGEQVSFLGKLEGRLHLVAQAESLVDLARFVADGRPQSAPSVVGYTILSELGRGGMAAVYLARQEKLGGRPVALKVLPPHVALSPMARERFRAEVLAVAKQRHPGIVPVYDVIEDGPTLAYAMEWIDGRTLEQVIGCVRDAPTFPPPPSPGNQNQPRAVPVDAMERVRAFLAASEPDVLEAGYWGFISRVGESVARALQSVHESGILHRDIKPSNIIIRRDGVALLSDFGVARNDGGPPVTATGGFLGTAPYAPPEQLGGRRDELTARSDVYSLGVTLYHALALRLPFTGRTPVEVAGQIQRGEALTLAFASPGIPEPLETIVARAMHPDPERRYGSAREMADDLRRFLAREPIHTPGPGYPISPRGVDSGHIWQRATKRRGVIWAGLAVAIFLTVGWIVQTQLTDVPGKKPIQSASHPAGQPQSPAPGQFAAPIRIVDPNGAAGDEFGCSMSGWGDRLLVGARYAGAPVGKDLITGVGAACIFELRDGLWTLTDRLVPPEPKLGSEFGSWVLLRGDIAIVAATGERVGDAPAAGAVYFFSHDKNGWVFRQRIVSPLPRAYDHFGYRLTVDGDILVIATDGLGREWRGHTHPACVYRVRDGTATLLTTLDPDGLEADDANGSRISCAVGAGGSLIVLGAGFADTPAGPQAGFLAAYVRDDPAVDVWRLVQVMSPENMHQDANLGSAVAVEACDGPESGPLRWTIAAGASALNQENAGQAGAVQVFEPRDDSSGDDTKANWFRTSELKSPVPMYTEHVGSSIDLVDGVLGVNQYAAGPSGPREGAVLVFRRRVDSRGVRRWSAPVKLTVPALTFDGFAYPVCVWRGGDGRVMLAGGHRNYRDVGRGDDVQARRGAVWVWRVPETAP